MTDEDVRELIRGKAVDGKVACRALLELAAQTRTSPKEVGRLCNELKLKIAACQLGCFR